MDNAKSFLKPGDFPTGCLCNAHPGVKVIGPKVKALWLGAKVAGPARTALTKPGQNAAIHRAVASAKPGEVLVVGTGGSEKYGFFGDILALASQKAGIVGLVIDGTVRDSREIKEMGFPVFCRGTNPSATKKDYSGAIDVAIDFGTVEVNPGDFIVGDDDGVVVVPRKLVHEVIGLAEGVLGREEVIKNQLQRGKTTCEIFKITP